MSYTIIYNTQFQKVGEDKYIPYLEMGASNCYETYTDSLGRLRQRRERHVDPIFDGLPRTEKQLMSELEQQLVEAIRRRGTTRKEMERGFGWYQAIYKNGKPVTYRQMQNLIKRGIKKVDNE